MKNKGLGKGLSALLSEHHSLGTNENEELNSVSYLSVENMEPSALQPRKTFDNEMLEELAQSIKSHGIIQPIIVRKLSDRKYEIIAGERRFRAAKMAGLNEVPVILRNISDSELGAESLIENIQRENLNPVEESEAYKKLINSFNLNQEQLAKALGKNRSHIANMLRICDMPENVKTQIRDNKISFGHAKVIASSEHIVKIANEIVKKSLSVRQTEHFVKSLKEKAQQKSSGKKENTTPTSDDINKISESISQFLGMKVKIEPQGMKGKVSINYTNFEELDQLIEILTSKNR